MTRGHLGKGNRHVAVVVAGSVLAALAVAEPAQAATGGLAARPGTARCTPAIKVLESLPGPDSPSSPWQHETRVNGIGPLGLAADRSPNRPVG